MNTTLLLALGGITVTLVGCGLLYSVSLRKKETKLIATEDVINGIVVNLEVEYIEKLSMSDVVFYFSGIELKKEDFPLVAKTTKDGKNCYLLSIYNEEKKTMSNSKLLSPNSIDEELVKTMKNDRLVVLS
ncbi:MAG TPA: hypothetical protein DDY68_06095 [Porphyromonadaceae bacterium]|nr:hypothetical protein [Porphyromonadaceae bacterium]